LRRNSRAETITPAFLRRRPLPLDARADKEQRGRVLVVGGTAQVPGAAILASIASLRAGAGKLQIAVPASIALHVAAAVPEALVIGLKERSGNIARSAARDICSYANDAGAVALGPGMSEGICTPLMCDVLKQLNVPVVVDAGALSACPIAGDLRGRAILTPHSGEMASLLERPREEIERQPQRFAQTAAQRFNAIVALKGPVTYVAAPDGRCLVNRNGHVGLATSGSGDALAGIIAGVLARGVEPLVAAAWGVYLHASAGQTLARRMGIGFLAHELLAEIPPAMKRLSSRS